MNYRSLYIPINPFTALIHNNIQYVFIDVSCITDANCSILSPKNVNKMRWFWFLTTCIMCPFLLPVSVLHCIYTFNSWYLSHLWIILPLNILILFIFWFDQKPFVYSEKHSFHNRHSFCRIVHILRDSQDLGIQTTLAQSSAATRPVGEARTSSGVKWEGHWQTSRAEAAGTPSTPCLSSRAELAVSENSYSAPLRPRSLQVFIPTVADSAD